MKKKRTSHQPQLPQVSLDFDPQKPAGNVKVEEDSFFYAGDAFTQEFDQYVRLDFSSLLPTSTVPLAANSTEQEGNVCYSNKPTRKVKRLVKLIRKAMPERFERLEVKRVLESEDEFKGASQFILGFVTTKQWTSPLTIGPQANTKEAEEFREFWGDKSELRKFADSQICECVAWGTSAYNFAPIRIIEHLVEKMLELPKTCVEWRSALPHGLFTASEEFEQINKVFGTVALDLRAMKDLPLIVTNIHGVSPYLRGTEPPLPSIFIPPQHKGEIPEGQTYSIPTVDHLPRYTPTVTVHLKLEHSTKWGSDLDAIRGLTTSFYLQMAREFKRLGNFTVPTENQLFVVRDRIVFELIIVHDRVGTLLEALIEKQKNQGAEVDKRMLLRLQEYRKRYIYDSALQASLASFAVVNRPFSDAVRIMKRWLGAKLLSGHVPELVLELLCAAVFCEKGREKPRSPWSAFRRVLHLLATHNWASQPLMVDLDATWTEDQITEMRRAFIKTRPVLPPMVIMSNEETQGARWTSEGPTPLILKRLVGLAKDTIEILDKHIEDGKAIKLTEVLLSHDLSPYDCIIEIREEAVVREIKTIEEDKGKKKVKREQGSEKKRKTKAPEKENEDKITEEILPVIDFDPVSEFVETLRCRFASSALFFYDKYASHAIGVKFKPKNENEGPQPKGDLVHKRLLEKIRKLGDGLVKEIHSN